jgi:uncharacterized protein (TIGR03790 family)
MKFWLLRISRRSAWLVVVLLMPSLAAALVPDEIALVINKNVPESRQLAEEYAKARHIPDGRIIETTSNPIAVNSPAEEITYLDFEPQIAQPVRDFLTKNNLRDKVKCLVTFWGVPLRVGQRTLGPLEVAELKEIQKELGATKWQILQSLGAVETMARQADPTFLAEKGEDLPQIPRRLDAAVNALVRRLPSASRGQQKFIQALGSIEQLVGTDRTRQIMGNPAVARLLARPPSREEVAKAAANVAQYQKDLAEAEAHGNTPEGRALARDIARKNMGLTVYGYILAAQLDLFDTTQSEAAVDSELALIWWTNYPRRKWVENPLSFRYQAALRQRRIGLPPVMVMVSRLDGPGVEVVRKIIETSVRVEAQGLSGQVVLDARGLPQGNGFGQYDQTIRNLADLLKAKTTLKVTLDNKPALLPAHQLNDPPIAVYCGWYSLRNYSPPGRFADGAVGFHVASFELISLRLPGERGWVRGLLSDGVVGTLGPVAEPFLQSFPTADEFFPLLFTGKVTLAEAYWRTTPMASWMHALIGDPLYNPYKNNPPLAVANLPDELTVALAAPLVAPPSTQPSPGTQPIATTPAGTTASQPGNAATQAAGPSDR